jgi:hypothetical protein
LTKATPAWLPRLGRNSVSRALFGAAAKARWCSTAPPNRGATATSQSTSQSSTKPARSTSTRLDRRGAAGAPCPEPDEAADRTRPGAQRFIVPEDLAQVPGFDDALYEEIADHVTVATRASAIDPLVASRPVLLAIPGATPGLVDNFLESRARWHDIAAADIGLGLAHVLPFVTTSPAREFTITATARSATRARYRADLLVRLTDTAAPPYEVLAARAPPVDRGRRVSPPPHRVP